ncbi:MAG TPA: ABC transporter ATP-binding protein [Acetobacteraceae bacterium]|nr:ABC transporter ATP-binding protein [Acetobacteraceae bacterium]
MSFVFSHVTKRFGSVVAIDDVSMRFEPGLIYAMIGPNGAGKSTLVNMAAGSYSVTAGSILLDDQPLQHLKKHQIAQAGVARTYQNIRLFDQMTVLDNLEVALAAADLRHTWREVLAPGYARQAATRRRQVCLQYLREFDLDDAADAHAELLPYGRQRMLEIARALVAGPRVLLLDEPAAGLNSAETESLKHRLLRLRRPDRVMIVIEHDMELVMSLSDRIYVLHHGALLFGGTPHEVQANRDVQEAYLGTDDDLDAIHELARNRRAGRRLRDETGAVRHPA